MTAGYSAKWNGGNTRQHWKGANYGYLVSCDTRQTRGVDHSNSIVRTDHHWMDGLVVSTSR